jgi:putative spermidine/putrescine transport system ATP-binding protein
MAPASIQLEGVEKRYGAVTALERTDLTVRKGEFLTLLGPSGSGKTTLLNLIAGTAEPTAGRILLGGRDVTKLPTHRRQLGMVFQNYALLPHMTVFENIAFPLRVRKLPETEIRRKVTETLELIRLPDIGTRKPRELSGGQQQRVAIARCLVYKPDLILMDEPLGALDKKLRDQMQFEIKGLHSRLGITTLYVTHDQSEALVMSDRICLMSQGRIEQLGTADELYFKPRSVFAASFLGESNILSATIARDDAGATLSIAGARGRKSVSRNGPGDATVMIRPENVAVNLLVAGIAPQRDGCDCFEADGLVTNTVLIGGVVEQRVKLTNGALLVSRRLTTFDYRAIAPGAAVRVSFDANAIVVLD